MGFALHYVDPAQPVLSMSAQREDLQRILGQKNCQHVHMHTKCYWVSSIKMPLNRSHKHKKNVYDGEQCTLISPE